MDTSLTLVSLGMLKSSRWLSLQFIGADIFVQKENDVHLTTPTIGLYSLRHFCGFQAICRGVSVLPRTTPDPVESCICTRDGHSQPRSFEIQPRGLLHQLSGSLHQPCSLKPGLLRCSSLSMIGRLILRRALMFRQATVLVDGGLHWHGNFTRVQSLDPVGQIWVHRYAIAGLVWLAVTS